VTRSLIQALQLSAQPTTQKTEVVPKLFDLDLPLRELVLKAPILQAQLLDHRGEVGDGRSLWCSIAFGLCRRRLRFGFLRGWTSSYAPPLSVRSLSWGCPLYRLWGAPLWYGSGLCNLRWRRRSCCRSILEELLCDRPK